MSSIGSLLADRVFETSTTQGVVAYVLGGPQAGFRSVASTYGNGGVGLFCATDDVDWELFRGTYTASTNSLSRDFVYSSSNGNAAMNWGAGTRNIFCEPSAAFLDRIVDPGFRPHCETVPAMTVRLDAGKIFDGVNLTAVAAQSSAAIVAPAVNPRIDRIVIDRATGAVAVIAGAENVAPVPPAIAAGKLPIAQIRLAITSAAITDSMITDERALGLLGSDAPAQLGAFAVAGGAADALTVAYAPAPVLQDGAEFKIRAAAANATTTPTLAVNGGAARTITKNGNQALAAGDIAGAGHEFTVRYVAAGPRFELVTPKTAIVALADAATTLAGIDAVKALTAAGFAGNKSIGANGYYKLPGGLIVQWGLSGVLAGSGSGVFAFPIAFPTTFFGAIVSVNSNAAAPSYTAIGLGSITVNNNSSNPVNVFVVAIGN